MPSGGPRVPNKPAAVSGPGALSQRTDGGPGAKQPIRVPAGGAYGQRQAAEAQQAAAPMAAGGPNLGGAPAAPARSASPVTEDIFAPTNFPSQVSGRSMGDPLVDDPQAFLRVLASRYPHPAIQRLVDWSTVSETSPR